LTSPRRRRLGILAAAIPAFALPAGAATYTVTVAPNGSFTFSPSSQTINVGDTVQWVWGLGLHSSTSGALCIADGKWDSTLISNPQTFSVTFTTAGTFPYYCTLHCFFGMTGEILVQEPTATPTPTVTATPTPTTTTTPIGTPTPSPLPATATPVRPGVIPTLSPSALALFAVALAAAALLLVRRS
jgi:plastocyanin